MLFFTNFFKEIIRFSKKSLRGDLTPYLWYLHTKLRNNKISLLGLSLYTDRQITCLNVIRDYSGEFHA